MREPRTIPEITPAIVDRFNSFVRATENGCHLWTGTKNAKGYGHFGIGAEVHRAHRIAYVIGHGVRPERELVCHACDNPSCVNPDHLWLGSPKDNVRDMILKGRRRATLGEPGFCQKCGHVRIDDYVDGRGGRRCRNCIKIRDARRQALGLRRKSAI